MPVDYIGQIKLAMSDIRALQKLRKEVDPASGLSISVRRGVARDNPDVEYDHKKRPWRTVEICDDMESLIDLLIKERSRSLSHWVKRAEAYSEEMISIRLDIAEFLAVTQ